MKLRLLLLPFISGLFLSPAFAQEIAPRLDSDRFTVRPEPKRPSPAPQSTQEQQKPTSRVPPAESAPVPTPIVEQRPVQAPAAPAVTEMPPVKVVKAEDVEDDRGEKEVNDSRVNIVNLTASPTLVYVDSKSDYWFRNYSSSGPGISIRGEVWFSRQFGIELDYMTTLSAEVRAETGAKRSVLVDHRYQSGSFIYRKYFGKSRRAPSLLLGAGYSEYQFIIPKQETERIRLKTTGPKITIATRWPTTNYTAWLWGAALLPKIIVKEQATAASVKSGTGETSYGMEVHLGREYVLDRQQNLNWKITHRFEKTVYEGQADTNDPRTGAAPSGVDVTSGTTIFSVGYTWGD